MRRQVQIVTCDLCGREDPDVFGIGDFPRMEHVADVCLECKESKTILDLLEAWDRRAAAHAV